LNPIEHLWKELVLKAEWDTIPTSVLINLVDSMPRRCGTVIKAKGFPTKY
jgi:hypothetical protein